MDFQSLKVQIEQGRRFEAPADGATFTLRLPHEHAWRAAAEENRDGRGRVLEAKTLRLLLDGALIGWRDVTARHFVHDAGEEPVAFSPEARAELLDSRQDIADALGEALGERRKEHTKRMRDARKNSSTAPSGT